MLVAGPVNMQVESVPHPPLAVKQLLIGVHTVPLPVYPELHAQVLTFEPVNVHVACVSHPPLLDKQLFTQHMLSCNSDGELHVHVIFPVGFDNVFTVPPR